MSSDESSEEYIDLAGAGKRAPVIEEMEDEESSEEEFITWTCPANNESGRSSSYFSSIEVQAIAQTLSDTPRKPLARADTFRQFLHRNMQRESLIGCFSQQHGDADGDSEEVDMSSLDAVSLGQHFQQLVEAESQWEPIKLEKRKTNARSVQSLDLRCWVSAEGLSKGGFKSRGVLKYPFAKIVSLLKKPERMAEYDVHVSDITINRSPNNRCVVAYQRSAKSKSDEDRSYLVEWYTSTLSDGSFLVLRRSPSDHRDKVGYVALSGFLISHLSFNSSVVDHIVIENNLQRKDALRRLALLPMVKRALKKKRKKQQHHSLVPFPATPVLTRRTTYKLSQLIRCLDFLLTKILELGYHSEGIFRLSILASENDRLERLLLAEKLTDLEEETDPHAFATLLKNMFQNLDPVLLPYECIGRPVGECWDQLQGDSRVALVTLFAFINQMSSPEITAHTRMDLTSLLIVFQPGLLQNPSQDPLELLACLSKEKEFLTELFHHVVGKLKKIDKEKKEGFALCIRLCCFVTSVMDAQVRASIWEGKLPLVFTLDKQHAPLYLMVSRLALLPSVFPAIRSHFGIDDASEDSDVGESWLEFEREVIQWHIPLGVLYDSLGGHRLPWKLDFFCSSTGFPAGTLLAGADDLQVVVKQNFMSSLKASNHLKFGDGALVMQMSKRDQDTLWLQNGAEDYWRIADTLLVEENMKSLSVRWIVQGTQRFIQRPLAIDLSLKDALEVVIKTDYKDVIIQGISPPLDTPLLWLQRTHSHPDNFLYIIVTK